MPEEKKKAYVSFDAGPVTMDSGLPGVKLDFNYGARVLLPDDGEYRVRFTDLDTSSILYDAAGRNALVTSTKKYYINFRVEIWKDGVPALASGLSWLAWGAGVPVVMIVGFTAPGTEFHTPYRVQQFHTCHSCANDQRYEHKYDDFGSCPRHRGTDQEFECTRCITSEYVRDMIDRVRGGS